MYRCICLAVASTLIFHSLSFGELLTLYHLCQHQMTVDGENVPAECCECTEFAGSLQFDIGKVFVYYDYQNNPDNPVTQDASICGDLPFFVVTNVNLPEGKEYGDIDVTVTTYGAVETEEGCEPGTTGYIWHQDIESVQYYQVELVGNYIDQSVMIQKTSGVPVDEAMVDDTVSYTKGGSSSLALNVGMQMEEGFKLILLSKLGGGWTIEQETVTNWSSTYTHTYKEAEVGRFTAMFYYQQRGNQQYKHRKVVTCSTFTEWSTESVYRGFPAEPVARNAASHAALSAMEQNAGFLSSDTTTLVVE